MTDIGEGQAAEFVTVAEAARRLGIGERRAYRAAAKLSDTDRKVSDMVSDSGGKVSDSRQTLVRLSALAGIVGVALTVETPSEAGGGLSDRVSDSGGKVSDSSTQTVRHLSDTGISSDGGATRQRRSSQPKTVKVRTRNREVEDELRERLEDMRQALDHERISHQRSQQLHLGTMAELESLRRRAAELQAANFKLIEALPVQVTESAGETEKVPADQSADTSASLASVTESDGTPPDGVDIPSGLSAGDSGPLPQEKSKQRGWFARLFGVGG